MSSLYGEALTTAFDAQTPASTHVRCPAARDTAGAGHACAAAVTPPPHGQSIRNLEAISTPIRGRVHRRSSQPCMAGPGANSFSSSAKPAIGQLGRLPHRPQEVTAAAGAAPHLAGVAGRRADFGIHWRPHGLAACRIAADAAIRSRKNSAAIQSAIHADSTTTPLTSPSWWK